MKQILRPPRIRLGFHHLPVAVGQNNNTDRVDTVYTLYRVCIYACHTWYIHVYICIIYIRYHNMIWMHVVCMRHIYIYDEDECYAFGAHLCSHSRCGHLFTCNVGTMHIRC